MSEDRPSPLLTIAIPTFNRATFLHQLLETLEGQIADFSEIEVLVSDNCSTDETPSVIDDFRRRGFTSRYIRNDSNIGPDANFLQCFQLSKGEYFWLIGDDDLICPGAIAHILQRLRTRQYDMLYLREFPVPKAGRNLDAIHHPKTKEFNDPRSYARRINVFFTFISANILRKDAALSGQESAFSNLVGTNLVQLGWTYAALNNMKCALLFETAMLGARIDNSGGYSFFEVFGPKLRKVTFDWVKDAEVARQIDNGTLRKFLSSFAWRAKHSQSEIASDGSITKLLKPVFRNNPRYWLFVAPILALPKWPATAWYIGVRAVNVLFRKLNIS